MARLLLTDQLFAFYISGRSPKGVLIMTAQHFTPSQHPPRIMRRHAAGHLVGLMLMLWLCDVVAGGSSALAQNIVSTPSALSL
ncbi:MAG TPA: hypothetical protein PLZ37_17960, partial [Nitrospira sp.]|nr:hypothetical protein [Nitrospira sp.]